jgi:hypothetical protein
MNPAPNRQTAIVLSFLLSIAVNARGGQEYRLRYGWSVSYFNGDAAHGQSGSISRLTAPSGTELYSASDSAGLFNWRMGSLVPAAVNENLLADSSLELHIPEFSDDHGNAAPVEVFLALCPSPEELTFTMRLTVHDTVRFDDGSAVLIPLETGARIDFYNTTPDTDSYLIHPDIPPNQRKPFQNLAAISGSQCRMLLTLRHPLLPVPMVTSQGLQLEFLVATPPNTTHPTGLGNICSILEPGDTISARWGIATPIADGYPSAYACLAPHPNAAEQTTLFAFDDIPMYESGVTPGWAVPTDPNNPRTAITNNLLRLLDAHPDVKFVWLLLTDNIQRLGNWYFPGWWPPTTTVIPDSSVVHSGQYSCRLHQPVDAQEAGVISAVLATTPGQRHVLRGFRRGSPASANDDFAIFILSWPNSMRIADTVLDLTPQWSSFEFPFNPGDHANISVTIYYEGNPGDLYLDDFSCTDSLGNESISNGGFEQFNPYITYDPPEPIWPNAHSFRYLAKEAPPEYRRWLRIIQDESPEWRYSSQVGLGLHGLHHTPDSLFTQSDHPIHEFDRYDVRGDSIRIGQIVDGLNAVGLDPSRILSFFRFPGHRHTESVLKPILENGVRIIDYGIVGTPENYFGSIHRHHRQLWQTQSCAWHDEWRADLTINLEAALDAGQFALQGTHFHIFASSTTPGAYLSADAILGWLESRYPHLQWLKADQLARVWDELGAIRDLRQEGWGDKLTLEWTGGLTVEQTALFWLPNDRREPALCLVDGKSAQWEQRGRRVFVVLPRLDDGPHRVDLYLASIGAQQFQRDEWKITRVTSQRVSLERLSGVDSDVVLELLDIQGRLIQKSEQHLAAGWQRANLELPSPSSGSYLLRVATNGIIEVQTLAIIH